MVSLSVVSPAVVSLTFAVIVWLLWQQVAREGLLTGRQVSLRLQPNQRLRLRHKVSDKVSGRQGQRETRSVVDKVSRGQHSKYLVLNLSVFTVCVTCQRCLHSLSEQQTPLFLLHTSDISAPAPKALFTLGNLRC